jgi:Sec-independent protein translocase protein TatA
MSLSKSDWHAYLTHAKQEHKRSQEIKRYRNPFPTSSIPHTLAHTHNTNTHSASTHTLPGSYRKIGQSLSRLHTHNSDEANDEDNDEGDKHSESEHSDSNSEHTHSEHTHNDNTHSSEHTHSSQDDEVDDVGEDDVNEEEGDNGLCDILSPLSLFLLSNDTDLIDP